jgi:L-amino acid N-acyltransferase YncA
MDFKIRKAKELDIDLIDDLYVSNSVDEVRLQFPKKNKSQIIKEFKRYEKNRRTGFIKDMKKKNEIWLIAYDKELILGFAQGLIEKGYNGKIGVIDKIYVPKKFRGKGFGTKMGKVLINELKKRKVDFLEYRTFAKNLPSLKLAKKLGLKPFSLRLRKKL